MGLWGWVIICIGALLALTGLAISLWSIWGDRAGERRRCPKCWYDMAGLSTHECPECGHTPRSPRYLRKTRRHYIRASLGLFVIMLGAAVAIAPAVKKHGFTEVFPTSVLVVVLQFYDTENETIFAKVSEEMAKNPDLPAWQERFVARHCAKIIAAEHASTDVQGQIFLVDYFMTVSHLGPNAKPALPAIMSAMNGPDNVNRNDAVRVILKLAKDLPAAADAAIVAMAQHTDPLIRLHLLEKLAWSDIDPQRLINGLIPMVHADPDQKTRLAALRTLWRIGLGKPGVGLAILETLEKDADPAMRSTAAEAIADFNADALPALRHAFTQDPEWFVRSAAMRSIVRMQDDRQQLVQTLIRGLDDPKTDVLTDVAGALERLGPAAALALPKLELLKTHETYLVRQAAKSAIRAISQSPAEGDQ